MYNTSTSTANQLQCIDFVCAKDGDIHAKKYIHFDNRICVSSSCIIYISIINLVGKQIERIT